MRCTWKRQLPQAEEFQAMLHNGCILDLVTVRLPQQNLVPGSLSLILIFLFDGPDESAF